MAQTRALEERLFHFTEELFLSVVKPACKERSPLMIMKALCFCRDDSEKKGIFSVAISQFFFLINSETLDWKHWT